MISNREGRDAARSQVAGSKRALLHLCPLGARAAWEDPVLGQAAGIGP